MPLAVVLAVLALLLPPQTPQVGAASPIRVSVLSLLRPQRIGIEARDRAADLSIGGVLAPHARLVIEREGREVVARLSDGRTWRGTRVVLGGPQRTLTLDVRGRDRRVRDVRGRTTIDSDGRTLRIVVETGLEDLVASAVAAELDQVTDPAALEAAAVALRSYIVASRGRHANEGFDLCDTTHCLFSRGVADVTAASPRACVAAGDATRGLVLARNGRVVAGYCTACCGGRTSTPSDVWGTRATGDYVPVACPFCSASPYYRWRRSADVEAVADALGAVVGRRLGADTDFDVVAGSGGWVRWVAVRSRGRTSRVGGDAFRMAVERRLGWDTIPSPRFEIERAGDRLRFSGAGYGHGIGLCIAGAVERARRGASREQILELYFPAARTELLEPTP